MAGLNVVFTGGKEKLKENITQPDRPQTTIIHFLVDQLVEVTSENIVIC